MRVGYGSNRQRALRALLFAVLLTTTYVILVNRGGLASIAVGMANKVAAFHT
jgi:hypothetical protein